MVPDSPMDLNDNAKMPLRRPEEPFKTPAVRPEKSPRRCTKPPGSPQKDPNKPIPLILHWFLHDLRVVTFWGIVQLKTS